MENAFFDESNQALSDISALFDIIWPLDLGLWNLRENVKVDETFFKHAWEQEFAKKYAGGSGLHGINYKKTCVNTSWESQQEALAWVVLGSLIPIYESWIENMRQKHFPALNVKRMQFPIDIIAEIRTQTVDQSAFMVKYYYPSYASEKKRNLSHLNEMLFCYRVFKEIRNCYMHNGRIADQKLCTAYQDYLPYANEAILKLGEIPEINPPTIGLSIKLNLRAVVCLSELLLNIIVTADAEFSKTRLAYLCFIQKFKESQYSRFTLENQNDYINQQIYNFVFAGNQSLRKPKDFLSFREDLKIINFASH